MKLCTLWLQHPAPPPCMSPNEITLSEITRWQGGRHETTSVLHLMQRRVKLMRLHHHLLSATDRRRARLLAVLAGATRRAQTALMPLPLLHDLPQLVVKSHFCYSGTNTQAGKQQNLPNQCTQTHSWTSFHVSPQTQQSMWKVDSGAHPFPDHCRMEWVFRLLNGISPQRSRRILALISRPRIPVIVLSTECFQFPSHLPITKAIMCTISVYFTYYSLDSS